MTVLIGVLCKDDAVVIGTDSSATFGVHPQFPTIEQTPCKKLFVINDDILVAGTGQIGLGQRFCDVVSRFRGGDDKGFYGKSKFEVGKGISAKAIEDFSSTGAPKAQFGALIAFATKSDKCCLVELALQDLQPEWKSEQLWFVSLGSGQPIADPMLGLLRRVLFADKQPTLREGIFAVTWTLQLAIELNSGGINGPPQIGVLKRETASTGYKARILDEDELQEHIARVEGAEQHLRNYLDLEQSTDAAQVPPVP